MAPHSSTLAWRIPWMEEPGGLQSMGSLRVWYDWASSLVLFTFIHWRRKWQPTPVFLPGESQGRGSLVGCRLWGHTSQTRLKWLSSSSSSISMKSNEIIFWKKNINPRYHSLLLLYQYNFTLQIFWRVGLENDRFSCNIKGNFNRDMDIRTFL